MKPRKMWTTVRSEPKDKYRNTIFATRKNIKDQFANMNGKRWKQDIIDQNSYMFAWNNVSPSPYIKILTPRIAQT